VWNAAADVSEGEAEAVTFAIRFANSESKKSQPQRVESDQGLTNISQTPTFSRRLSSRPSKRTRPCSTGLLLLLRLPPRLLLELSLLS
jgi:hypothetical protein